MPFVTVLGIPPDTDPGLLYQLRVNIVTSVSQTMQVPKKWVRPFFPIDQLEEPLLEEDGASTIFVRLETAMFTGQLPKGKEGMPLKVTAELAQIIWAAFDGRYEVEVMLSQLHPTWKHLIKAKDQDQAHT